MNDLRIVNLSSYTSPEIVEKSNKQWVAYGSDNNFFGHLISNYENSPTNNAIINAISQQIYGLGLDASDSSRRPEQYAKMLTMFHKDCVQKLCFDLKLMGQCAMQVIYSKDRKTIAKVAHIPVENLRAEKCNEKGEIEGYFYSDDWSNVKPRTELKRIPAYGSSKENIEIIYVKPYRAGYKYYSSPDYTGCLQWCEIESEVSNFHLNNVQGSFSPNTLIQFNNGTPNAEERQNLENRIAQKFTGTGGNKFILAFNDNQDAAATVETLPISDAHNTYEYVSSQATEKIMVGHRVVSPMLYGIKDSTGLGNNADELKTASILMQNLVIAPFQHLLIDAFDSILAYNQISLKLYFKTLQPLQFIDLENVEDEETKEEETGVKLSKELPDEIGTAIADALIDLGQDESELLSDFEVIDEREVDYDEESGLDEVITDLNKPKEKSTLAKVWEFVSTGVAKKTKSSEQDGTSKQTKEEGKEFLVRYVYNPAKTKSNSRQFCSKMVKAGKVYRKEDILAMTKKAVNPDFTKSGDKSGKYSIWLYKGGARCSHRWFRKTYVRKIGGKRMGTEISTTEARSRGFRPKGKPNAQKVPVAPKDMKYKGYTAEYWNKIGFKN
jgi:hypothetical protein